MVTIMKTRELNGSTLRVKLGDRVKKLEELGMDHKEACEFASDIMNIGIALQEKHDSEK